VQAEARETRYKANPHHFLPFVFTIVSLQSLYSIATSGSILTKVIGWFCARDMLSRYCNWRSPINEPDWRENPAVISGDCLNSRQVFGIPLAQWKIDQFLSRTCSTILDLREHAIQCLPLFGLPLDTVITTLHSAVFRLCLLILQLPRNINYVCYLLHSPRYSNRIQSRCAQPQKKHVIWSLVCVYIYIYIYIYICTEYIYGARGSVVAKALCYKPEGRGFDTRWGEFLNLPNPSGHTRQWCLLSL
jgi:hypothetical protein